MKKMLLTFFICLLLVGCGKYTKNNFIDDFNNKIKDSYQLSGLLSVLNNDDVFQYKIDVYHLSKDFYKVVLTNTSNNYAQILLKNTDGVYVLTPSLNKSFRFNSDWPYNNSQIFLLDTIISDIKNDRNSTFSKKKNKYVLTSSVNYSNNAKLVRQELFFDKSLKPSKAVVYDNNDVAIMTMNFNKVSFSKKISKNEFKIDSIISSDNTVDNSVSSIDDIIYPLYVPSGTKLSNEERINKNNGERVILNYDGEKSFLLVEETADVFDEFTVIPSSGEPYQLFDTLGVLTDNSLMWSNGGVDFYIVSDVMSQNELVEVARSITSIDSIK